MPAPARVIGYTLDDLRPTWVRGPGDYLGPPPGFDTKDIIVCRGCTGHIGECEGEPLLSTSEGWENLRCVKCGYRLIVCEWNLLGETAMDNDGQVIIYTGMHLNEDGTVKEAN